jgi:hypothetical protein
MGPWHEVLRKTMADPIPVANPPLRMGYTMDARYAQYVKLTCLDYYNDGCALHYFGIE